MQPAKRLGVPKDTMRNWTLVGNIFKSKSLVLVLLLGNVALGLTTMAQSQVIQGQKKLIRLLFQDSAELASYKIAANAAKLSKR